MCLLNMSWQSIEAFCDCLFISTIYICEIHTLFITKEGKMNEAFTEFFEKTHSVNTSMPEIKLFERLAYFQSGSSE